MSSGRTTGKAPDEQPPPRRPKLVETFADRYGMDAEKLLPTLKATAFRLPEGEVSDAQMMALLLVANEYGLNPFTKEIYAYPDKNKGIVPVVSIDGWIRIIQSHPQYAGVQFNYSETMLELGEDDEHPPCFEWIETVIFRKDHPEHPTVTREYFDECYRDPIKKNGNNGPYTINGPWQTHPKRMLRHKSLIQGGRVAFGFGGIFDEDEAQRIVDTSVVAEVPQGGSRTDAAKEKLRGLEAPKAREGDELLRPSVPVQGRETVPVDAQRETNVPRGATVAEQGKMPWDDEGGGSFDPPTTKTEDHTDEASWIASVKMCKSKRQLDMTWGNILIAYDAAGIEVPMELEATYTFRKESLAEGA